MDGIKMMLALKWEFVNLVGINIFVFLLQGGVAQFSS